MYLALCIFSETWQIEYILFMYLFYFYSACFYHHFFQVSHAVWHLSNKIDYLLFWPLGG